MAEKFKIFILIWNLLPGLSRTCKIWWWCSLFLFYTIFYKFYSKNLLAFWCYLIDLSAVYSQRLETSDLFCFIIKTCFTSFFSFFYFKPMVTPLFIQLFCNNMYVSSKNEGVDLTKTVQLFYFHFIPTVYKCLRSYIGNFKGKYLLNKLLKKNWKQVS